MLSRLAAALLLICANLRNLRINLYSQISQIAQIEIITMHGRGGQCMEEKGEVLNATTHFQSAFIREICGSIHIFADYADLRR